MIRKLYYNLLEQGPIALLRPAILLAVLTLAFMLSRRPTQESLQVVAIIVFGFLGILVVIHRIEAGIAGLFLVSLLVRLEIDTGTKIPVNATVLVALGLIGVWLVTMMVIERDVRIAPLKVNYLALAFVVATTVSLMLGNLPFFPMAEERATFSAQLGGWSIYALSMGIFLLAGDRIKDIRWLRTLTWVFLTIGGAYLIFRALPFLAPLRSRIFVHPKSFGSMFWTWMVAMSFGQFLFNRDLKVNQRLLMLALTLGVFGVNLVQTRGWISGWLPPLAALIVVLWQRSRRAGLAVLILGVAFFLLNNSQVSAGVFDTTEQYSFYSRTATWPILFEIISASPLVGLGPANYYYFTPLFPILGWYVKFNSHNNYMDILAQTGLLGLGLFLWLAYEIGRLGLKVYRRELDGFSRGYVAGVLGGFAGMLLSGFLGDWFMPFLYNISFQGFRVSIFGWIFLGGLIALYRITSQESKT